LTVDNWPPDYRAVFEWRQKQLLRLQSSPTLLYGAKEYYRTHPVEFIEHWLTTYDPRHAGHPDKLTTMPFVLFPRQRELVDFIYQCIGTEVNGLVEKCRDMGATWICCAVSVHLWLFMPEAAIGWGSRKQDLVDNLGILDSVLEKIRVLIRNLPRIFWPVGFDPKTHMPFLRIINPQNGASIQGESGDDIGRGGRKLLYFVDEAAHLERPEKAEASLGDTTRVRIDISSVNGLGNVFHKKREAGIEWQPGKPLVRGKTSVFVMDWRDHPEKTDAWFEERRADYEDRGVSHLFAQEVERNYAASLHGTIIKPEWIRAALDVDLEPSGRWIAGLDVADEGGDKNALVGRKGPCALMADHWGEGDTAQTTVRALGLLRGTAEVEHISFQYDSIGVGAGVRGEANRLDREGKLPKTITFTPWAASAKVLYPDRRIIPGDPKSMLNSDYFANLRAQAWFQLARRFKNTYQYVKENREFEPDDLISLKALAKHPLIRQIEKELSQVTQGLSASSLKMTINKKPDGTSSPNLADAFAMCYWPVGGGMIYSAGNLS
jgi:phage terminase large subunit